MEGWNTKLHSSSTSFAFYVA